MYAFQQIILDIEDEMFDLSGAKRFISFHFDVNSFDSCKPKTMKGALKILWRSHYELLQNI